MENEGQQQQIPEMAPRVKGSTLGGIVKEGDKFLEKKPMGCGPR